MRIFKNCQTRQTRRDTLKNQTYSQTQTHDVADADALAKKLNAVCEELASRGVFVRRQSNLSTAEISPMGVGGTCVAAFYPDTLAVFTELVSALKERKISFAVLGAAANVLIPDGSEPSTADCAKIPETVATKSRYVLRGALVFTKYLKSLAVDGESIFAFCGVTGAEAVRRAREARLTGLEFLSGIPCTIGGATYMNAGAHGNNMSCVVESVLSYGNGDMRVYTARECGFSYKQSKFMKSGELILGVTLRLKRSSEDQIDSESAKIKSLRAHLPKGKSLGCIFKNPSPLKAGEKGRSAGALIENAGLKGLRKGGAVVSETHANFIVNEGGATYQNVCELIEEIKSKVYETQGVRLEEEICYLNDLWQ